VVLILVDTVGDAVPIRVGEAFVDEAIPVVVEAVAHLRGVWLAAEIGAVDEPVAVVVHSIATGWITGRTLVNRRTLRVCGVNQPLKIVYNAVPTGRIPERPLLQAVRDGEMEDVAARHAAVDAVAHQAGRVGVQERAGHAGARKLEGGSRPAAAVGIPDPG